MSTNIEQHIPSMMMPSMIGDDLKKSDQINGGEMKMGEQQHMSMDMKTSMQTSTIMNNKQQQQNHQMINGEKNSQMHPLHNFDVTQMSRFYESCAAKMCEQHPEWQTSQWTHAKPMPGHLNAEEQKKWANPIVFGSKQVLFEAIRQLARESGEPMILMPNFEYGDILDFKRFLQALKVDGINAISKYKQYLNNKDMDKGRMEIDLVCIHPRHGVMLFEVRDCHILDNKRRSHARMQLNNAHNCFRSLGRLVFEAKGWTTQEAHVPIMECIVLPNQEERPLSNLNEKMDIKTTTTNNTNNQLNQSANLNQSTDSTTGITSQNTRSTRSSMHFMVKGDLATPADFAKWWQMNVTDAHKTREAEMKEQNKTNKFDESTISWMTGLITCIRNNSIMPIVCSEMNTLVGCGENKDQKCENKSQEILSEGDLEKQKLEKEKEMERARHMPALHLKGEMFERKHEAVRSHSKVIIMCNGMEMVRATLCKQILWMLLNDHQKKISVVCAEQNKPYYEEFFMHQRKIYNNCTNVRFYTDIESCTLDGQHSTLKKDVETWFFDAGLKKPLETVMERVRVLPTFWVFTTEEEKMNQWKNEMETLKVKMIKLESTDEMNKKMSNMSLTNEMTSFKLPMRLECDVLIIGDVVGTMHLKSLYRLMTNNTVPNLSHMYTKDGHEAQMNQQQDFPMNGRRNNQQQQQKDNQKETMMRLAFNPAKRFKTIKFIRGGSIENIRNSLKMHDSIQAQVVLMHVGEEDLIKSRSATTTADRIKELAVLVKEFCPKSFLLISTLMRREQQLQRSENVVTVEVNKAIKEACKEYKQTHNFHYMLNTNFNPNEHMTEERTLNNKGLTRFVDNFLWTIDHFMFRNGKQI